MTNLGQLNPAEPRKERMRTMALRLVLSDEFQKIHPKQQKALLQRLTIEHFLEKGGNEKFNLTETYQGFVFL